MTLDIRRQKLLAALQKQRSAPTLPPEKPVQATALRPDFGYPLSFSQTRLWFLEQLEPGSPAYHETTAVRLFGELDVERLQSGLARLAERHESLRTRFRTRDGGPVQSIAEAGSLDLTLLRCEESEFPERARDFAALPFDLESGQVARAGLFAFGTHDHALLLVLHHIVVDGWSARILVHELFRLYDGETLAEAPLPYRDYAAWHLATHHPESAEYWRNRLRDAVRPELPADPEAAVGGKQGRRVKVELNGGLVAPLAQLARDRNCSFYTALLALWAAVLQQWSGQTDLLVASPVSQRPRREFERIVGLFLNTLALRIDLSGDPSFEELLSRISDSVGQDLAHQNYGFERVVADMPALRHAHSSPFSVMLVLQPPETSDFRLPTSASGLRIEPLDAHNGATKVDLTLGVRHNPNGDLVGYLEYACELFLPETIERLLARLQSALDQLGKNPRLRLSELQLPAREASRLAEFSSGSPLKIVSSDLQQAFALQVARQPEAVAVREGSRAWTCAEIDGWSDQIGWMLLSRGVASGDRVGVAIGPGALRTATLLAILKSGAAYLPLEREDPDAYTQRILRDSSPVLVLYDTPDAWLDGVAGVLVGPPDPDRPCEPHPQRCTGESIMAVLYTSGSSGAAKGVMVTHRATMNRLAWMWHELPFHERDVLCQKTALGFVDSVWEVFGGLLQGVPTVPLARTSVLDFDKLANALQESEVTRLVLVPSVLGELIEVPDITDRLAKLEILVSSGEALPRWMAQQVLARLPHVRLFNLYGSTEIAGDVTAWEIRAEDPIPALGVPISNTSILLLDDHRRLVPWGSTGEIYAGGANLAAGYWNNPEESERRFVSHPFCEGERLYRTGDRGRWDARGALHYRGRADRQLKIRGHRIEPAVIEAALLEHPQVQEAAVLAQDGGLAVYLSTRTPRTLEELDLWNWLRQRLPRAVLPTRYFVLDSLPRTSRGKLDHARLLERNQEPALQESRPLGEVESGLLSLWREVLQSDSLSVEGNFFEHGGNSLMAVALLHACERKYGVKLSLAALFEEPTVNAMAAHVAQGRHQDRSPLVVLQSGTQGRTLYVIHPAGGGLTLYADLIRSLGPSLRVCGFQALELDVDSLEISALASRYVDELLARQPEGPYLLLGLSLGGVLGFEMACQLESRGHKVESLIVVDTYAPGYWGGRQSFLGLTGPAYEKVKRNCLLMQRIKLQIGTLLARVPMREWPGYLHSRILREVNREPARPPTRTNINLIAALHAYSPPPEQCYHGHLLLTRASYQPPRSGGRPDLGWSKWMSQAPEIMVIPGLHGTALLEDPYAAPLAARLRRRFSLPD